MALAPSFPTGLIQWVNLELQPEFGCGHVLIKDYPLLPLSGVLVPVIACCFRRGKCSVPFSRFMWSITALMNGSSPPVPAPTPPQFSWQIRVSGDGGPPHSFFSAPEATETPTDWGQTGVLCQQSGFLGTMVQFWGRVNPNQPGAVPIRLGLELCFDRHDSGVPNLVQNIFSV